MSFVNHSDSASSFNFTENGKYTIHPVGCCDVPDKDKDKRPATELLLNRRFTGIDGKELSEDQIPKGNANSFRNPAGFDIENHRRQIKDLIDAIKENREPMVNVYEGKKPVDIILAAYESSKTGKKVLLY